MTVDDFSTYRELARQNGKGKLEIELTAPTPLVDIASRLGLPAAEIAFAAVNGVAVPLRQAEVRDADRVELFPPNCGG